MGRYKMIVLVYLQYVHFPYVSDESESESRPVVSDSVTPWTVAHQASLSMNFPGKNTGVGCHFLFQGIFLSQGSNLGLLHCRCILSDTSIKREKVEDIN